MFNIARKRHIHNFYLAKTVKKAPHIEETMNYGVNLKRSVVISLLLIIICFNLYPYYTKQKIYKKIQDISTLEVIDIPVIELEQPPPPPVNIVEPMTMVKVEEPKVDKENLKEEIKEMDLKLDIANDDNELLLASSQLGDFGSLSFSSRNIDRQSMGSLDLEYSRSRPNLNSGNPLSLDLGSPDAKVNKKYKEKSINLDTKSLVAQNKPKKPKKPISNYESNLEKVIQVDKDQFLLRESESTIGTTEFKTWNRINAVLDRLNKDRYGELPVNVKRISNGLAVSFSYRNGKAHDIFWSKGGKVIIRVTGAQPKSNIDELQRAYDALLRLLYKTNSSTS